MLEDFSEAMALREDADYGLIYSEDSALIVLESAGKFLEGARGILDSIMKKSLGRAARRIKKIRNESLSPGWSSAREIRKRRDRGHLQSSLGEWKMSDKEADRIFPGLRKRWRKSTMSLRAKSKNT